MCVCIVKPNKKVRYLKQGDNVLYFLDMGWEMGFVNNNNKYIRRQK